MKTLGVIGVGLMGGSFALAAKKTGLFDRVLGDDREKKDLDKAISTNVCDGELREADDVEAICIAVPTEDIAELVQSVAKSYSDSVTIFDVGSVKASILKALNPIPPNYVPCHPITGSHRRGIDAADASLFDETVCVVTPDFNTKEWCIERTCEYWDTIGANVVVQTPEEHDQTLSMTSHLPHLLSFALVDVLSKRQGYEEFLGNGFRDFSRIAGSDPRVWSNILVDNASFIAKDLREISHSLDQLVDLARSDKQKLKDRLEEINTYYRKLNVR